jgi:hypothetical protein
VLRPTSPIQKYNDAIATGIGTFVWICFSGTQALRCPNALWDENEKQLALAVNM